MWLGSERVVDLDLYLAGYVRARVHLGEDDSDGAVLEGFTSWLRLRVDQGRPSSLGWPGLIARIDPSAKNVWTFFNEFEAFLIEGGDELVPHREAWNAARLAAPRGAGTVLPDADAVVRRLGQRVIRVDEEMLSASLLAAFPFAVGRVDWRKVPGTVFRRAPPERSAGANNGPGTLDTRAYVAEVVRFFRECVSATGDAPDSWVMFVGDNLECDYKVQLSAVGELFEELADVPEHKYVISANCSWCFMWSFEDDLYFGLRPSRPPRSARQ